MLIERETIGLLLLAVLVAAGCGHQEQEKEVIHSVILTQPEGAGATGSATFSGVVREGSETGVSFKVAGQIAQLRVKEGDQVRQGQLLATLDDSDYRLGLEAAEAQYNQLKNEVGRIERLKEAGGVSGNEYEKAVAGLQQVEVNLKNNRNRVENTRLVAPVDGVVQSVNFHVAEMVNAGMPVVSLIETRGMEVEIAVPATVCLNRQHIKAMTCRGDFTEGRGVAVSLASVQPKANGSGLYMMRLTLPAGVAARAAGMNAEVEITMDNSDSSAALALPASSLFEYEGKSCVWLFAEGDSTVHRHEVRLLPAAKHDGEDLVSVEGLQATDRVVRAGVHHLRQGERVRPIEAAAETNAGGLL